MMRSSMSARWTPFASLPRWLGPSRRDRRGSSSSPSAPIATPTVRRSKTPGSIEPVAILRVAGLRASFGPCTKGAQPAGTLPSKQMWKRPALPHRFRYGRAAGLEVGTANAPACPAASERVPILNRHTRTSSIAVVSGAAPPCSLSYEERACLASAVRLSGEAAAHRPEADSGEDEGGGEEDRHLEPLEGPVAAGGLVGDREVELGG